MSTIKTFITAFCTGAVLLGTVYILVPKGGTKKAVQYAFCLSFLCIVLSVAIKISGSDFPSFNAGKQNFDNEKLSAALAKTVFAAALGEKNIKYKKITVFTDKTDSGGISITKVYVYTAADYRDVKAAIGSKDYKLVVINE
ncbi:MAG: hypothetical protein J5852_09830 [Clostridia bacterium]|nr:hypothetical protein [Clostridia bacterium]